MYSYFTISLESCEVYMVFSRARGGGFSLFAFAGWWVGLIDWFDWFGWPIKWLVK